MGGDLCADFLKGACHRPGYRYSHADPNGRARGDGAPSSGELGFGAGAPSEAKGFGGFEGGFGVAEKQLFFNDAPRGAGAWAQKPTPGIGCAAGATPSTSRSGTIATGVARRDPTAPWTSPPRTSTSTFEDESDRRRGREDARRDATETVG